MLRYIPIYGLLLATLTPALAMGAVPDERAFRAAQAHNGRSIGPRVHVAANTTTGKSVSVPVPEPRPAKAGQLTTTQVQTNPFTLLQKFSASDLQAALDDANGQNPPDKTSAQCYSALLAVVNSPINKPLPSQLGLFLALQKARDAKAFLANLQSPNGPLASLNIACAPLIMDVNATLLGLGVTTGLVMGTGGIALPALSALPGLITLLPK